MGLPQTPEKTNAFVPRRWLRGGHRQTVASFLIQRHIHIPAPEARMIQVAPGVQVLCHCHWQPDRAGALTVIVVHGLEGSSESQYMLGITDKALRVGMNVIRYNQRNCGGTDSLAPVLYHSGLSTDIDTVARHLIASDGLSRLALAGFSMGGNLVLKLAGEWAQHGPPQFRAVAACCPALDLAASADALHEPSNRIYEKYFLWALRRRMLHKARLFPQDFDRNRLEGIRSLREFDDKITAYYCGFQGAVDYYDRASAAHVVGNIAVPALILHSANDPFIRITPDTRRKIQANPNIKFIETEDGGHCAFIGQRNGTASEGLSPDVNHSNKDDGYWAETQIVNFLQQFR